MVRRQPDALNDGKPLEGLAMRDARFSHSQDDNGRYDDDGGHIVNWADLVEFEEYVNTHNGEE